jgi:dTDP-4-dehydrorhamnose 3,5-epimerase|tara:strand:+ start:120 stop:671 length:552 start_codon:yes stop_codon:yes gene_type:complete
MKLSRANIPDLVICEPKKLKDERGFFCESFRKDSLENLLGYSLNFCQENLSESKYGVLRGLHFQIEPNAQSKLVSVVKGRILDVAVDIRKNSKFYGQSFSIELDDKTNKQLFIPKGFAHGFVVLSKTARVSYKVDNYYNPKSERGLNYNDPLLEIDWKIDKKSIITNEKDNNYSSFDSEFFFE